LLFHKLIAVYRHRWTKEDRAVAAATHSAHLAMLVARAVLVNNWANDAQVQAAALSCLPIELLVAYPPVATVAAVAGGSSSSSSSTNNSIMYSCNSYWCSHEGVERLLAWCKMWVTLVGGTSGENVTDDEGGSGSEPRRLFQVLAQKAGASYEIVQVFLALCRAIGLQARYVMMIVFNASSSRCTVHNKHAYIVSVIAHFHSSVCRSVLIVVRACYVLTCIVCFHMYVLLLQILCLFRSSTC
jgi:Transglutaminase-like superfamily